jgi:hypothetical protein
MSTTRRAGRTGDGRVERVQPRGRARDAGLRPLSVRPKKYGRFAWRERHGAEPAVAE